jgi:hypothetical protein
MAVTEDEDVVPLTDEELEAIEVKATVAIDTPPGTVAPEPRPRKDALEEAHSDVLRLVKEVRRHRGREKRWKEGLKAALAENDSEVLKKTAEDLLDEAL